MPIPARRKAGTLPAWHGLLFHRGANGCATTMKPLIRKLWYTLTEAANYLTRNTEGDSEVTVSDVLQLAVNEQIALSIKVTGVSDYSVPFGHLIPLGVLSDGERMDALNREVEISGLTSPTIINSEKFHVAYQGNIMLDVGLWDLEFQSAKRILNKLWGDSKTLIDSDIDRLNPWTFKSLYYGPYDDKIVIFDMDLNVIISVPPERIPEGTYLVVKQSELSRLLTDDSTNTEHHKCPPAITTLDDETEIKRLQRTIAALALGLAAKPGTYNKAGKPNVLQLAKVATEHLRDGQSDRTPHGFSETTVRNTITAALKACPELKG